jgi:hypothetical protein
MIHYDKNGDEIVLSTLEGWLGLGVEGLGLGIRVALEIKVKVWLGSVLD